VVKQLVNWSVSEPESLIAAVVRLLIRDPQFSNPPQFETLARFYVIVNIPNIWENLEGLIKNFTTFSYS